MKKDRNIFQFHRVDVITRTLDITVHAHSVKEATELAGKEVSWEHCIESEVIAVGELKLAYAGRPITIDQMDIEGES